MLSTLIMQDSGTIADFNDDRGHVRLDRDGSLVAFHRARILGGEPIVGSNVMIVHDDDRVFVVDVQPHRL